MLLTTLMSSEARISALIGSNRNRHKKKIQKNDTTLHGIGAGRDTVEQGWGSDPGGQEIFSNA